MKSIRGEVILEAFRTFHSPFYSIGAEAARIFVVSPKRNPDVLHNG